MPPVIERTGNNHLYGRGCDISAWPGHVLEVGSGPGWRCIIQKGATTLVRTAEHLEINDN